MADDGRKDSNNRAGIIIRTADGILIGHTPNEARDKNGWDLPKGHIAVDEDPENGAVREAKEETGLDINPDDLVFLGKHRYQSGIIYLYGYDMSEFTYADLADLKCTSMFDWASYADGNIIMKNTVWPKDAIKRKYPEVTEFALVSPEELEQQLYYGLYHSLTPAAKDWINGKTDIMLTDADVRIQEPVKTNHFNFSSKDAEHNNYSQSLFDFDDILVDDSDYTIVDEEDIYNEPYTRSLFDDIYDEYNDYSSDSYDRYNDEWN